ncbi:MAG: amidohydrolase [Candidatus Sericytochromatia bacterium]
MLSSSEKLPHLDEIIHLRRILHMQPELAGQEEVTARILESFLQQHQPQQLLTGLGGQGLAAIFDSGKAGPSLLLRADMDGLPIEESNDLLYRSTHTGIAHKCGHDGHMAILAGLAPVLKQNPPSLGRVILLFQPAEETGEGAQAVLKDPQFQALNYDYCFALHNLPKFPLGAVIIKEDVFAAASVGLKIELKGATSHAAYPERGKSPAQAMAEIILKLETLNQIFKNQAPFALLTIVSARLGEASFGITPGEATIMATLRSYQDQTLEDLRTRALAEVTQIAQKHQLDCACSWHDYFPATHNHPMATELVRAGAQARGWIAQAPPEPFRWSEDFGWFSQSVPGALFGLGAGEQLTLHSADYDFPEELLEMGIHLFSEIIAQLLY